MFTICLALSDVGHRAGFLVPLLLLKLLFGHIGVALLLVYGQIFPLIKYHFEMFPHWAIFRTTTKILLHKKKPGRKGFVSVS